MVWTPELDAIIGEGYGRGWSGALEAITKIQQLHPKWRSHVVWDRAAKLGFTAGYVKERPPWSATDDATLKDFVGEHSVTTLAHWLHRSEVSVRKRASTLGVSARVRDNYTQAELARELRLNPRILRRWEMAGVLKRRDGRITEESFKDFCKQYGSEIDYENLDRETQFWLKETAGFDPDRARATKGKALRRHLQRIGICPHCGRRTRGNAHGWHVKVCVQRAGTEKGGNTPNIREHPREGQSSADSTT